VNRKYRHSRKRRTLRRPDPNNLVILTEKGRFAPNTWRCNLLWGDQTSNRGNVGSNAGNFTLRSSAYDPDPSFGTGAIPGFTELATLYSSYCVHSMQVKCEFGNHEINPIVVGILPSNVFMNTNSLVRSDCIEYLANVKGRRKMLGAAGAQAVKTISTFANGRELLSHRLFTDLDFSASTSTNPLALFYLNYFFYVPGTANFSYNIDFDNLITFDVEFFDRRVLES